MKYIVKRPEVHVVELMVEADSKKRGYEESL